MVSETGLLTNLLVDLGQVTDPLWASVSFCIKEARQGWISSMTLNMPPNNSVPQFLHCEKGREPLALLGH